MKHYAEAENLLEIALKQSEHVSPQDRVMTIRSLGLVYSAQKQYSRAAEQFQSAVDLLAQIDGKDSLALAETLEDLGTARLKANQAKKALESFDRALAIHKSRGTGDTDVLSLLTMAARAAKAGGDNSKAESLFARVASVAKGKKPGERKEMLTAVREYRDLLRKNASNRKTELEAVESMLKESHSRPGEPS